MRQYRGLTKEGELVYGDLVNLDMYGDANNEGKMAIHTYGIYGSEVEVIPETVGQSTGLRDKNGTEIYEGDKIQESYGDIGVVYWKQVTAGFYCKWGDGSDMALNYGVATVKSKVIDNIHTHPELMEQDNDSKNP